MQPHDPKSTRSTRSGRSLPRPSSRPSCADAGWRRAQRPPSTARPFHPITTDHTRQSRRLFEHTQAPPQPLSSSSSASECLSQQTLPTARHCNPASRATPVAPHAHPKRTLLARLGKTLALGSHQRTRLPPLSTIQSAQTLVHSACHGVKPARCLAKPPSLGARPRAAESGLESGTELSRNPPRPVFTGA